MIQERWLTPVKTKLKPMQPACQQKGSCNLTGRQLFTAKAIPVQESDRPEQISDSLKSSRISVSTVQLALFSSQSRDSRLTSSTPPKDVRHSSHYDRHALVKELETMKSCIRLLHLQKVSTACETRSEDDTYYFGPRTCMSQQRKLDNDKLFLPEASCICREPTRTGCHKFHLLVD